MEILHLKKLKKFLFVRSSIKKLYVGKLEKEHFLLPEIYERNYPLDDLHYVYIGEITDVYTNK